MTTTYDAIVIGAGHNGLTTAGFLAKAGKRVLVVERRGTLGGAASTEELFPGYKVNTGAPTAGMLRPEVVAGLDLKRHGLEWLDAPARLYAPLPDGRALTLWADPAKAAAEIARFSPRDAERYPAFCAQVERFAAVLAAMMTLTPPQVTANQPLLDVWPWARVALKVKGLGEREMMEFLRVLPMAAAEYLDEWFENEVLKGALGAAAVAGTLQGPRSAGTAFMLLYQRTGMRGGGQVRGGTGQLAQALARAAELFGAEIRTGVAVEQILLQDEKAVGVVLGDGAIFRAGVVVSAISPRETLFQLVGAQHLPVQFVRRVKNIRFRGSTAAVHLALRGLPGFVGGPAREALSGEIVICPSLDYLERAYDAAKYGGWSPEPLLRAWMPTVLDPSLAPEGGHVLSVMAQFAPDKLAEGSWETEKAALEAAVVARLAEFAPGLPGLIVGRHTITPLDWEREYGLAEGGIFHGQMGLDQLLYMRPVAGFGQYAMPVEGLFLGGAGAHPGGGVTGAPGYNAARTILRRSS